MIIYGFTVNQNQRKYEDIDRELWTSGLNLTQQPTVPDRPRCLFCHSAGRSNPEVMSAILTELKNIYRVVDTQFSHYKPLIAYCLFSKKNIESY